jgi:hypothetical protein
MLAAIAEAAAQWERSPHATQDIIAKCSLTEFEASEWLRGVRFSEGKVDAHMISDTLNILQRVGVIDRADAPIEQIVHTAQ